MDDRTEIPDLSCFPRRGDSRSFYKDWASANSEWFKRELDEINVPSTGSRQVMYDRLLGATLYYEEYAGIRNLEEEEKAAAATVNETEIEGEDEYEDNNWVQCEKCEKWRSIPASVDAESLPDNWYCELNDWNDFNTCKKPEEEGANDEKVEKTTEDDEVNDEEEEEQEDFPYLRRLLNEFKQLREETLEKKRKRAEDKALEEEERKRAKAERLSDKIYEALDLPAKEKMAAYKAVKKKSSIGQLPMHKYCEQFAESTAVFKTLVDIAFLKEYNEEVEKYVNHQDKYGRTPLHYAIMGRCYEVEKVLKDAGANPYICDISEKCPEEYGLFRFPKEKKSYLDDII